MKARDLMSSPVVSVSADASVSQISSILSAHRISGAPVVDADGSLIGIISDSDLIGRDESKRQIRRKWWLALMAGGNEIHPETLSRAANLTAKEVMSAPVITINEDAEHEEIGRLMIAYSIKRVPVVQAGRICGIITRRDLYRAMIQEHYVGTPEGHSGIFDGVIAALDHGILTNTNKMADSPPAPTKNQEDGFDASGFRRLVSNFENEKVEERKSARQAAAEQRRARVAELIDHHIKDEDWRALVHQARKAAENGEKNFMLLRFPSALCADGGRSINVGEVDWPSSLRGEAAEIYLRWKNDLRPRGFHLSANILDFPNGLPGDVGLFLIWGQQVS
jgi:CBS domain-containing protein